MEVRDIILNENAIGLNNHELYRFVLGKLSNLKCYSTEYFTNQEVDIAIDKIKAWIVAQND